MNDEEQNSLIASAKESGLEKELAYCLNSINSFFEMPAGKLMNYIEERHNDDLNCVIAPTENKLYCYTEKNVSKRFFAKDRIKLLEETNI